MIKKRRVALYIFLSIITLGIYSIVFWSKWANDLNKICDDEDTDSATYILVLILDLMSFGIYSLVWNYRMGERMYQKAPDFGVEIKHGGMFMLFWRFFPIVTSVYKIKYINKLAAAYNANATAEAAEAAPEVAVEAPEEETVAE